MDRIALVCRNVWENPSITQRELAQNMDISLGTANTLMRQCLEEELICTTEEETHTVTEKGMKLLEPYRVDGAVILAAGFGSRFVPLTFDTPKGLLDVCGERMIERQIRQLKERGIHNITIVVGYLKEKFEYLIDKYQVKLLYNRDYATTNTLTTILHARHLMEGKNMYLLYSDNWMRDNMFHAYECGAWYTAYFMKGNTAEWPFIYNKKGKVTKIRTGGHDCWVMYGPVYFSREFSNAMFPLFEIYKKLPGTEQFYWEDVYFELINELAAQRLTEAGIDPKKSLPSSPDCDLYVNRQPEGQIHEFENLEELRQFDARYQDHSDNQAMQLISRVFQIKQSEIHNIRCLKAGLTNHSFLFQVQGESYICRIPGEGTALLIDRAKEGETLETVKDLDFSEDIVYFDKETGYKISRFFEGSRNSDARNWEEMAHNMELLRRLHQSGLTVSHSLDIRERIEYQEKLCLEQTSIPFEDYETVKKHVYEVLQWVELQDRPVVLTHQDPNPDNFIILPDGSFRLVDWEYATMFDPLMDLASCCSYANYNEEETERLLRLYLQREPQPQEEQMLYAYLVLYGFWCALWAIYKTALGTEFGEYTINNYRLAKIYYRKLFSKL